MKSFCLTDVGVKRKMNQDFVYASQQPVGNLENLFIVADGMGGHKAGDYASRCCVETMVETIENTPLIKPVEVLKAAAKQANQKILEKSRSDKDYEGMGTTLLACTSRDNILYIANVGDSRLYIIDDRIDQMTHDHSLVEEMVMRGELSRDKARTHPDKNIITRAVGVMDDLKVDFFDVSLNPGDIVLLCSDGLTNMVEDEDILKIVKRAESLEEAAHSLINAANDAGGTDNISAVLAEPVECGDLEI